MARKIDAARYTKQRKAPVGMGHWIVEITHPNGSKEPIMFSCDWANIQKYANTYIDRNHGKKYRCKLTLLP